MGFNSVFKGLNLLKEHGSAKKVNKFTAGQKKPAIFLLFPH